MLLVLIVVIRSVGEMIASAELFHWLESLQPVVQGALIALSGVSITVVANLISTALQLRNSRRERQLDRQHTLKKDVYLEFSADFQESLKAFSAISDTGSSFDDLNGFAQKASRSSAKLELIAPPKTIAELKSLNEKITKSFLELGPQAFELRNRQFDADLCSKSIQNAQDEQVRIVELIKQLNLSGAEDPEKIRTLERWYEEARKIYQEESSQRDIYFDLVRSGQRALSIKSFEVIEEISLDIDRLFSQLRIDIDIDKDGGFAYRRAAKINHAGLRDTALEAIGKLPKNIT